VDASGNVYVTGESSATWQGPGGQNPLHAYNASQDITVLKLDTNGAYQWHTFYGSDSHNYGHAIAVNGNGVYVAGDGFGTWLGDGGSNPLHPLGSSSGLTVLRLNTSGAYQWHTFYDNSASNVHHGIAADETGNIFVSGTSSDSWLGDESTSPIHTYTDGNDITVLKLNDAMTLTVSQEGTGSGTVTSSPSGIDCGSNCTADFAYNSSVTLLASADRGSSFTGWTGCDNPSGFYCTMVMDADKTVTATFGTATGIKVISPNGGEVLPAGSSQLIQWEAPLKAVTFKLKYSLDKGLTWKPIISSDPITGTSFMWTVPSVNKNMNTCLVKVDGFTASNVKVGSDKSNGPFKIEVVRLTLPNGGEALTSGIPYSVTWTTHETVREVASVKIMYTINGGKTWKNAGTETGNPGFHDWTPSVGTTKTKCKVKIILKDQNGASLGSDLSDTFFRIEANQ
jgi:hypothetical protein